MTGRVGVGVIGAGVISRQYLGNLTAFPDVEVHAIGDVRESVSKERAEEYGVPAYGAPSVVLDHPGVEIVVNLTIPAAHAEVGMAAIDAGKHVWNEKPLATDKDGANALLAAADAAGVRLGGAPDTFLGPGLQTGLRVLAEGRAGRPLSGIFMFQTNGPEAWHPNPDFLFAPGGGPLFDVGPYYLTTMVQIFGAVTEVAAIGSRCRDQRTIGSGPRAGESFNVNVPTNVSVLLRFASGASAQGVLSFDSPLPRQGFVEVTGTDATVAFPDPNAFGGAVRVWPSGADDWEATEVGPAKASRGIGVLEMARAIRSGEPHRASGELMNHVLDIMCAAEEAIVEERYVPVTSKVDRAAPLPGGWDPFVATLR